MSQSDYLKYKKMGVILKQQTELPNVLSPHELSDYKTYSLENTISNTKLTYNQLTPTGKTNILGMEKKVTNCPQFIVCKETKNRPYRKTAIYVPTLCNPIAPIYKKKVNVGSGDTIHTKYCNFGCPKEKNRNLVVGPCICMGR